VAAFFFDNDANLRIGRGLEERGHLVLSARGAGLAPASDAEILLYAGPAGLIIVTHNERHFVRLHQAAAVEHAGILSIPQVLPVRVPAFIPGLGPALAADLHSAGLPNVTHSSDRKLNGPE